MTTRAAFVVQTDGTLAVYQGADDILDYAIDHADFLTGADAILTSTWSSTGAVTVTAPAQDGAVASAFVAGTDGGVTHTVTTVLGRRKAVTFCVLPEPVAVCA